MGRMCAVFRCGINSSNKLNVSVYKFPDEESVRRTWVQFVKRTRKDFTVPTKYQAICSLHFTSDCFEDDSIHRLKQQVGLNQNKRGRQLKKDAVPTILTDKCMQAMSRHSPAALSCQKRSVTGDTDRKKRTRQRELVKSISELKHARLEMAPGASMESSVSLDETATSSTLTSSSNAMQDPPLFLSASDDPEVFCATSVGPSTPAGRKEMRHQGFTANIRPHKRSKGTLMKPVLKDVGIQCNMQTTDSSESATVHQAMKVKLPLRCSIPADFNHDDTMDTDFDSEPELDELNPADGDAEFDPAAESCSSEDEEIESPNISTDTPTTPAYEDRKYIIFQSSLLELFKYCPSCRGPGKTMLSELGTFLTVEFSCMECDHTFEWYSQPMINKMPVGNLLLSSAIVFSGSLVNQVFRFLDTMNIARHSQKTFYHHQTRYLQPTIINKWLQDQQEVLDAASLLPGGLVLTGDGRSDSPGHSAKFGGFNTIECRLNKVVDIQVVQSNEVGNSARCENEGLKRMFQFLQDKGHHIDVIITDRHRANEKTIREEFQVRHYFDVWHVAKSITKKLNQLANKRRMDTVAMWRKSIVNHLHWVAASTPDGDADTMVAKWLSLLNHIVDRHEGHDDFLLQLNHHVKQQLHGHLFPACLHRPLQPDERQKLWFTPGTEEYEGVCKVVENSSLLKDVRKLSPLYQTSSLESFHSLVVRFCPKHTAFSWLGMYCRLFLAAMHFNENSNRGEVCDAEGNAKISVMFPKAKKGDYSVKILKEKPTYEYVKALKEELFTKYTESASALAASLPDRFCEKPDALTTGYYHPSLEEARATYTSRFAQP